MNGWFKILQYKNKHTAKIEKLAEQAWLCRYPRSRIITHNHSNELLRHLFKINLIQNEYIIKSKFAIMSNMQAN